MSTTSLSVKHLLGIRQLTLADIQSIFRRTSEHKQQHEDNTTTQSLKSVQICNLFSEDSTRTRLSFQTAESRLGASILNFTGQGSSVSKGESLLDTVKVLRAMGTHAFVVRHGCSHAPHFFANNCDTVVINGGDGKHEHPTQALLDTFTLHERWGTNSDANRTGFERKHVAIVGDIRHSRVANSNILALQKLGATVEVCGPPSLIPRGLQRLGVEVSHDLTSTISRADAIIMLRMQFERQNQSYIPSIEEYVRYFGISGARHGDAWNEGVPILHPGPVNRGVELDAAMADSPHSVILEQVSNGVFVRMAVLDLLLGDSQAK